MNKLLETAVGRREKAEVDGSAGEGEPGDAEEKEEDEDGDDEDANVVVK